jgi:hypothetical protein
MIRCEQTPLHAGCASKTEAGNIHDRRECHTQPHVAWEKQA